MAESVAIAGSPRKVSVVTPAWNAAGTIEQTLASLQAQTLRDWEAVVVDDGSTDRTAEVVSAIAATDSRIRIVRQASAGAAEARNRGLGATSNPWLLFLDADDWILPQHLERLSHVLDASPDAHAAVCGWTLWRDGVEIESEYCHGHGDLFPILARRPAFAIHTCIVARAVVDAVGGFDPRFRVHQDWVLWQRIARMGARFAVIRDPLAVYRLHDASLTSNQPRLAAEALEVISLGHRTDPAVHRPAVEHAAGRPSHELVDAQVTHLAWPAGIEIGRGADARPLFDGIAGTALGAAEHVGSILARAAATVASPSVLTAADQWPGLSQRLGALLDTLAAATADVALPRTARLDFERLLLRDTSPGRTLSAIGSAAVEITESIGDVPAAGIERLRISVTMEGEPLGVIELPVVEGRLRAAVLSDAIAAAYAWPVLGRYFAHTVYATWTMRRGTAGWDAWQGMRRMSSGLSEDPVARLAELHDRVGWELFIEEIWNPKSSARWWHRLVRQRTARSRSGDPGVARVEVSEPLPRVPHDVSLALLAGGAAVTLVDGSATPADKVLRKRLTDAAGFELCRVVVREALLGQPLDGAPLLERLARAAARREGARAMPGEWKLAAGPAADVAPGAMQALAAIAAEGGHTVLGRHGGGTPHSAASRVADFPAESLGALRRLAQATDVQLWTRASDAPSERMPAIAYAPDVVAARPAPRTATPDAPRHVEPRAGLDAMTPYGRHHFERLFASGADPWHYDEPYERRKYDQTLSLIGDGRVRLALEVGCAEGHFTSRLAGRADQVIAADISDIALTRLAARCAADGIGNVVTRRLDLARDPLPDGIDLIVCSEVLYYMGDRQALAAVAGKLAAALAPGGALVTAHANVLADAPNDTGFDWGLAYGARTIAGTFAAVDGLALEHELRTPLYRIQRFRRLARGTNPSQPVIEELPNDILPSGPTATGLRWGGAAAPMPAVTSITTTRLPILMYHRVAPQAAPPRARYTIHPDRFESHLQHLRDAGFRSATTDEWQAAAVARRPLEGRRVLLTFDDSYDDFGATAWPLLQRYGFDALVFVVTGRVGMTNDWDPSGAGESLLSWDALRSLASAGVHLGSHSESHPRLTSCTVRELVDQLARSRAEITERVGAAPMSIAYPWGGEDAVVHHVAGACGYTAGFTCRHGAATASDAMLALPRLEVPGDIAFSSFVQLLDS